MLHRYINQFLEYCQLADFSVRSIQALTARLNEFETYLKSQKIRLTGCGHCFIMIFLRLAGFFRQFREYVCPAFSVPGFRSGVLRITAG
jgi:hypothetical protein